MSTPTPKFTKGLSIKNMECPDAPNYLKISHTSKQMLDKYQSTISNNSKQRFAKTPQFSLGVSYEAPEFFKTNKNTIIFQRSYKNPYIYTNNNQDKIYSQLVNIRQAKMNELNNNQFKINHDIQQGGGSHQNNLQKDIAHVQPKQEMVKIYDCLTSSHKQIAMQNNNFDMTQNTFSQIFNNQLNKQQTFNRTSGLFTDFLEKNQNQKVFGPLASSDTRAGNLNFQAKMKKKIDKNSNSMVKQSQNASIQQLQVKSTSSSHINSITSPREDFIQDQYQLEADFINNNSQKDCEQISQISKQNKNNRRKSSHQDEEIYKNLSKQLGKQKHSVFSNQTNNNNINNLHSQQFKTPREKFREEFEKQLGYLKHQNFLQQQQDEQNHVQSIINQIKHNTEKENIFQQFDDLKTPKHIEKIIKKYQHTKTNTLLSSIDQLQNPADISQLILSETSRKYATPKIRVSSLEIQNIKFNENKYLKRDKEYRKDWQNLIIKQNIKRIMKEKVEKLGLFPKIQLI